MSNNDHYLLKIPFVSKRRYKEMLGLKLNGCKYSFEGYAYYIINNKYEIIWEKGEFTSIETYRPNDEDMLKTDFFKNTLKKNIDREKLFGYSDRKSVV